MNRRIQQECFMFLEACGINFASVIVTEYVFTKPFTITFGLQDDWVNRKFSGCVTGDLVWYTDGLLMDQSIGYDVYSASSVQAWITLGVTVLHFKVKYSIF